MPMHVFARFKCNIYKHVITEEQIVSSQLVNIVEKHEEKKLTWIVFVYFNSGYFVQQEL